jgi:class 3 adenylate cyclase
MPAESSESQPPLEIASVLFTDIVGFSLNPMEKQNELLGTLQQIVRATGQFKKAHAAGNLISLPTGDGMALAFFRDPVAPVKCAIEIQTALHSHPELPLRTGVHSGPVFRHSDIQDNINIVGGGINMAQRVMDCGDAGHILISQSVAEVLEQLTDWPASLHDLGICQVKHGVRLQLYNVYRDGVGNPDLPAKLKAQQPKPAEVHPRRKWPVLLAAIAAVLLAALYFAYAHTDWFQKAETKQAGTKNILRYYVLVQKFRNGKPFERPFRLSGERVFEQGYQVRLVISSPTENYLYVLNEGPKSTADKPDLNTLGSARLNGGEELKIPQGGFFVFDKEKGVEKLWVVWSSAAIPDLEALKKWANTKDRGAIGDSEQARAILALLKKYPITKTDAQRDDANQVTILTGNGDVLAYVISLDHD